MKILALDIGLTTGYAVGDVKKQPKFGELATDDISEYQSFSTAKVIEDFILLNLSSKDFCIIEGYAYGGGFFNYLQPEITGQVKRFLVTKKIPYVCPPANSMRLAVLGKGNASKMEVAKWALRSFQGIEPGTSRHISDAALAWQFAKLYFTGLLGIVHHKNFQDSVVGGKK